MSIAAAMKIQRRFQPNARLPHQARTKSSAMAAMVTQSSQAV
jgi:hypothetical protein